MGAGVELEQGGRGALSEAGEPGGVSCLLYSPYIVERLYRDCTETVHWKMGWRVVAGVAGPG